MFTVTLSCFASTTNQVTTTSTQTISQQNTQPEKVFKCSDTDKVIGGVCGGLGEYFGIDSKFIRIGFAVFGCFCGGGVLVYCICWFVMSN